MTIIKVDIDDVIKLKKPHPCGTNEWLVKRVGMDIDLSCLGCGRAMRIARSKVNHDFRGYIKRGAE